MNERTSSAKGEAALSYLRGMCLSFKREFTLREVVARMLQERPEMVLDFADAWEELIRAKCICVRTNGRPCTYELREEPGEPDGPVG